MKELYNDIFIETFNVPANDLNDKFTFKDIEKWDSITHLNLIMKLEDNFDVVFDTEDILNFGSYENGLKILQRYGVKFDN